MCKVSVRSPDREPVTQPRRVVQVGDSQGDLTELFGNSRESQMY